jgi:hypothetical protein
MENNELVKVKGHKFKAFNRKLSSYRKAIQIQNDIIQNLRSIGVTDVDDIEIEIPRLVIRTTPASIEWWQDGYRLYYSFQLAGSYISNLHVISKVIEAEIELVKSNQKTMTEFFKEFSEDEDIEEQRKKARELLGVNEKCIDLDEINKAYKVLAMKHHPDRPEGNHESFKAINNAHKMLKRELT